MNKHRKSQRGQTLVIIAIASVALLGMSGLAIDGGILFADRRHAQNAADAAAFAGAFEVLQGNTPYAAAYSRAADNEFNDNETTNWVDVYWPPISGPYAGNNQYVQTQIVSNVDSVFAHFVYGGQLQNTVNAIARAKPATVEPLLMGNAIVGLAETGCAVVWSHGNNNTNIDGGGIHVNSDHPDCAFKASGSNVLNVSHPISVVGGFEIAGTASVSPLPDSGADGLVKPYIEPPTCSTNAVRDDGAGTFTPGYTDNFSFHGGTWDLDSGIYCIDGGFNINSGTVFNGSDVLFYIMSGDVTWNGGAEIHVDAMNDGEFAGLLIYQALGNTSMATINGSSDSTFTGTMFFPDAEVQINGGGGADGFHSQVIGDTVDMSGSSDITIVYNEDENYQVRDPAQVELTE